MASDAEDILDDPEADAELEDEGQADAAEQEEDAEEAPSDRVADLVEYIVCSLVSDVDAVSLDVTDNGDGTLIEITCAADDAGRVIGRKGRTIKSIRTLARALGQRVGTSVEVEVLD
ncbi:MAG: KH domain-containing protein [Atopobiaceae bacterium]|jgi:predicted RNA-binding protein YlqC (UPF0109 family)|nr:KH domain-containing protein [Atopobiaceae bacterium]MCH4119228.1 KH domain-containing protein [Atopobiaceae bacterium]MCI1317991.1 KH domain-containing protein [Atopobiaceae bacterium]MCI1388512.1 KH domain-containing protein [Atopobiaceae bacterium]MCI1432011.1 KH domain-containing protein [Atopobiaceae bacterium]